MTKTPQNGQTRTDAAWLNSALLWLTLLLAFRLLALAVNRTDLMFDEAQYWSWAQEPAFGYFSKPPLLAWIIGAVTDVCGSGEFCVRLASPLLYWGTGLLTFFTAKALYDARTAFWAAIVLSTTPGMAFSSALISTDVPLLFCWAGALLAWIRYLKTGDWRWAAVLGVAIGMGLNAKYAMAYFVPCAAIALLLIPEARRKALRPNLLSALLLPVVLILPNMIWNLNNGFVTLSHTADNANWAGLALHPGKALEFFASQFGVFGPVLFAMLLWIAWRAVREDLPQSDRMLLCFSLPVIVLIVGQALLSRAHANWAAVAYPAAAILVTAVMLRGEFRALFRASLTINLAAMLLVAAANWAAPALALQGVNAHFKRMLGWRDMAATVRERLTTQKFGAIITDDRWVTAELLYYLRDLDVAVRAWKPGPRPRDHYELTRPFAGRQTGPYLLVTLHNSSAYITDHFGAARPLPHVDVAAGRRSLRRVQFVVLDGYRRKGEPAR